jgi:diadenosine tetraphosphatase ApaH/serine/threonine PP2A family protein phosphatase
MECENSVLPKLERCELLDAEELIDLLNRVKPIFDAEPNVINIKGPVTVVSDIHGQFFELLEIFKIGGALPEHQYLFLGDIVDRGYHSVESIVYLFALKEMYPHRITILRGSHESISITQVYGFYDEIQRKYGHHPTLFRNVCDVFNYLPLCAIIDEKAFCAHGGLSPHINTIEDILAIDRKRDIPYEGPMTDLLYSVPEKDVEGFIISPRGAGYIFGKNIVDTFLNVNGLELMVQSCYLREDGAEFIFDGKLLKLFSPTKYTYLENNRGAVVLLYLDKDGNLQKKISFVPQSPKTIEFMNNLKKVSLLDEDQQM